MTQEEKDLVAWYNQAYGTELNESNWINRLGWWAISRYQSLSEPFMERHADRLDW
jgi:hypothetical protein